MPIKVTKYTIIFILFMMLSNLLFGEVARFRCMWRDNPSSTLVIGWDQISGNSPRLYYDLIDHGTNPNEYAFSKEPSSTNISKGMQNSFVRLGGLLPDTRYYFLIEDDNSCSEVYHFRTAPNNHDKRISIIAGSDSRNHRAARIDANKLVGKLRPNLVMFGGDFTENDNAEEWKCWFDDWQHTISKDGKMTPIVVARGNHEYSNRTLIDLFDVKDQNITYALTFGGDLLRIYQLNTLIAVGGIQRQWLKNDLEDNPHITWKIAQYHHGMRPHTSAKDEKTTILVNWAHLFYKYGVQLIVESDAHVVKSTYPIRPSKDPGSDEGFIIDKFSGSVYVGEGCWGAPLREANDDKQWTRASGSFNSFQWIFVDRDQIEIRTIKTDGADKVSSVDPKNHFEIPEGLNVWNPPTGSVVTIPRIRAEYPKDDPDDDLLAFAEAKSPENGMPLKIKSFSAKRIYGDVEIKWSIHEVPEYAQIEILRSIDDWRNFQVIATYKPEEIKDSIEFAFRDKRIIDNFSGKYLRYRLRQIKSSTPTRSQKKEHPKKTRIVNRPPQKVLVDKNSKQLQIKYHVAEGGFINIKLITNKKEVTRKWEVKNQPSGKYLKTLDFGRIPRGEYNLIVSSNNQIITRYIVIVP